MNTELREKNAKNYFEKDFFKLMNNAVFGKTIEDVRKHRGIKLVVNKARRNYLVSEQTIIQQIIFEKCFSHRIENKTQIFMNKPVYIGRSILEISKIAMHEFWYDYVKRKYREKAKLLHKYRQLYSLHKNKKYLRRH